MISPHEIPSSSGTTNLKRKHSSTSDQGSEQGRSGRRWLQGLKARLLDTSQDDSDPDPDPAPTDSGYVTGQGTPDTQRTVNRESSATGSLPELGRDGWKIFRKSVSPDKVERFREIVPELEKLLTAHLRERGGTLLFTKTPRLKPRAIRLLVLGACEEDAQETIVVFCSEHETSRIQSFFDSDQIAKDLCQPSDKSLPGFRVLVSGHPFRLTTGEWCNIETVADSDTFNGNTLCGRPILFRKAAPLPTTLTTLTNSLPMRKGTLGGIIQVISDKGFHRYYATTAGHVLLDWLQVNCGETPRTEVHSTECAKSPTLGEPFLGDGFELQLVTSGPGQERCEAGSSVSIESPWNIKSEEHIGFVMGGPYESLQDHFSRLWACDLALVPLDPWGTILPNQLLIRDEKSPGNSQSVIRKRDLTTVFDGFPYTLRDVAIMTASRGLVYGVVSYIPARVSVIDDEFIEVYVVTLNDDYAISEGDSGAWVVDTLTWQVYGHVIGVQDILGDVYVVPMSTTLSNVRRHLGAAEVKLPSPLDFATLSLELGGATFPALPAQTPPDFSDADQFDRDLDSGYSSKHSTPSKSNKLSKLGL
ncbi:hypothetical protein QBC47DRAFT_400617 [Echria macrotheca]|uniref:Uncharacterized protein n=1 Tax=Echria macrotheca TaxID=438768 RepID=A0AAJ0FB44_9PEZI|nr:hypothetical protein QBC47DRAFT_400617 [Echria macrotheca]